MARRRITSYLGAAIPKGEPMNLLNRIVTATALVALAVFSGVWHTRPSVTAAPVTLAVKTGPEPTLAPPPVPVHPATTSTIIEVPVEVEIAATADLCPTATPAEPKPEPKPACQSHRRGLFRHRKPLS